MICKECGAENTDSSVVCKKCRAQLTIEENKPKKAKKTNALTWVFLAVSIVLTVSLVIVSISKPALTVSNDFEEPISKAAVGFKTPEKAIEYFVENIRKGEYDAALASSCYSLIAENFDYQQFSENIEVLSPPEHLTPTEFDLYKTIHANYNESLVLEQISMIVFQLNAQGRYSELVKGFPIGIEGADVDFDELIACFDPRVLKYLKIDNIDKSSYVENSAYKKDMVEMAVSHGAEDATSRSVLFKFNGYYYAGGFTLMKYDGLWYIDNMAEMLPSMRYSGNLEELEDRQEFKAYLIRTDIEL